MLGIGLVKDQVTQPCIPVATEGLGAEFGYLNADLAIVPRDNLQEDVVVSMLAVDGHGIDGADVRESGCWRCHCSPYRCDGFLGLRNRSYYTINTQKQSYSVSLYFYKNE